MSNVKTNNMVTALENLEIRQNVSVFFFYFQGCGQLPQDQHRETDPDAARHHQDDPRRASLLRVQPVYA